MDKNRKDKNLKERAENVFQALSLEYPSARCTLNLKNPQQFLFANILSPQCTDAVANRVSDALWEKFGTIDGIADANVEEIEHVIKPCGMNRVKSRHIHASANLLRDEFKGSVPRTLEELTRFPGIGRKTALVIMLEVYGTVEGIIIDTHNIRIAQRVGLTRSKSAERIEQDLQGIVPRKYWRLWSHLMVFHGRERCTARSPRCKKCPILNYCEFGQSVKNPTE